MNVGSICSRHIVSLDAAESLQTAAQRMREFHVGAVVVTRSEGAAVHVVGLLTDRDLAIEVLARGGDASQVPVERLAQTPPAGILDSADLLEAVKLMAHQGVRRLVVHDAHAKDSTLAFELSQLTDTQTLSASPIGIFRDIDRAVFDDQARKQVSMPLDRTSELQKLITGRDTWTVL